MQFHLHLVEASQTGQIDNMEGFQDILLLKRRLTQVLLTTVLCAMDYWLPGG